MRSSSTAAKLFGLAALAFCGCEKEPEPSAIKPREAPKLEPVMPAQPSTPAAPAPAIATPTAPSAAVPAPAPAPATQPTEEAELALSPPAGWVEKPPRAMIAQLYLLPKVEGDADDAEVTVSFLSAKVPLQMNINRWCGQFDLNEGKNCADAAQQRPLADTKYPTTIVEIAGAYKGSMMRPGPAKPGYRMIAAEISTPAKPWYVKLVGPEKTVRHWEAAFNEFVSSAK